MFRRCISHKNELSDGSFTSFPPKMRCANILLLHFPGKWSSKKQCCFPPEKIFNKKSSKLLLFIFNRLNFFSITPPATAQMYFIRTVANG